MRKKPTTQPPLLVIQCALSMLVIAGCEQVKLDEEVRRLCAIDGGIKVYETVTLPQDRFDRYGAIRIPSKEDAKPTDQFYYEHSTTYLRTGDPVMWRSQHRVIRATDGKLLGESVSYSRRGGDIPGPWHESSFGCPEVGIRPNLNESVFIKADPK